MSASFWSVAKFCVRWESLTCLDAFDDTCVRSDLTDEKMPRESSKVTGDVRWVVGPDFVT